LIGDNGLSEAQLAAAQGAKTQGVENSLRRASDQVARACHAVGIWVVSVIHQGRLHA
jgi:hypothetical protein